MAFIEKLPCSDGFDWLLVVVDRLTKYAHFIPLKHPFTAPIVAVAFVKEAVRLHGFLQTIVSDRDKLFLSHFWTDFFRLQSTSLNHSSAYYPQSDGQTEVVNRSIETYLRYFIGDKPKQWVKWLPWAEFWYNTSYHTTTNTTPFVAHYHRVSPPLLRFELGSTPFSAVEDQLRDHDLVSEELKQHLLRAQQKMKASADKKRRDLHFQAEDWVYVNLKPYRHKSLAKRLNEKLSPRYFGPYQVEAQVGQVAYRLDLPASTSIHPVFHVSMLRLAVGAVQQAQPFPLLLTEDLEWKVELEAVEGLRYNSKGVLEALIKWHNLPAFESSWEDFEVINTQFHSFHLEDKVRVREGGIVRPLVKYTYVRQNKAGAKTELGG